YPSAFILSFLKPFLIFKSSSSITQHPILHPKFHTIIQNAIPQSPSFITQTAGLLHPQIPQ
ncbi:hypothetical protein, partial [Bacillus subtilis]|uniref:hypothetical protein n=1 Tax=Bacillus subtilis TaxID=1423 RepID=UPI001BDBA042